MAVAGWGTEIGFATLARYDNGACLGAVEGSRLAAISRSERRVLIAQPQVQGQPGRELKVILRVQVPRCVCAPKVSEG